MNSDAGLRLRLQFLAQVVRKECRYLASTDGRLFSTIFTVDSAARLEDDPDLAERVDAFVSRFGRLQDTLGDKLLPQVLVALGERPGAAIDNLDRAERLGWIVSVEMWMRMRHLRNQMVHEYIDNPLILADALQAGHGFVPVLIATADVLLALMHNRAWL